MQSRSLDRSFYYLAEAYKIHINTGRTNLFSSKRNAVRRKKAICYSLDRKAHGVTLHSCKPLKKLEVKIALSEKSPLIIEKLATISKVRAHFSLFRSNFFLLKQFSLLIFLACKQGNP